MGEAARGRMEITGEAFFKVVRPDLAKKKNALSLPSLTEEIRNMAHHKSALKRIRSNEKKRLHNRYYHKTARNAVRDLRALTDKAAASALLPKVSSMLDKLAKRNIIHKNKASNLKSSLAVYVAKLG
jgi:small subunit ribosomal protein S20